ncbi:hypothetical protein [Undibacterium sp. TS12]|uniref:hypothetical protein n=1 Tax=Undibacterium sp. TS12 TaxID=2908202 RepID=UPI001F4D1D5C|nr:hypothetical protein [Undibacterium sp. TS12]MCH8621415.1 hypothetical protein [Undibacterium sp. TS12]
MKLSIEAPENEATLPGEVHLHIRFRPANMFGILLALLVHAVLLYFLLSMHVVNKKKGENAGANAPLVLLMDRTAQPKQATAPKKQPTKSTPVRIPPSRNAITQPKLPPLVESKSPVPPPEPPPQVNAPPEMDMMASVNAARERRRAADEAAAQENEGARQAGRGMSPQEIAEANVRRSMQQANGRGGSGVFQLISTSTRMATFSFHGWNTRAIASGRKQFFEVDAGLGGDVHLAVVRRMIEIIRMEYQGDFNWESQRLGRVVRLSARVADSAELENFLLKEFFK